MSNCDNCLHRYICPIVYEAYDCSYFDDKSEYIHLPCKVGDTVYYFRGGYYRDRSNWEITPIKVTEISMKINRSGRVMPLSIIANGTRYPISSIGKTVFLSREEAERALKKSNKE